MYINVRHWRVFSLILDSTIVYGKPSILYLLNSRVSVHPVAYTAAKGNTLKKKSFYVWGKTIRHLGICVKTVVRKDLVESIQITILTDRADCV
jgi:hypothetical protein